MLESESRLEDCPRSSIANFCCADCSKGNAAESLDLAPPNGGKLDAVFVLSSRNTPSLGPCAAEPASEPSLAGLATGCAFVVHLGIWVKVLVGAEMVDEFAAANGEGRMPLGGSAMVNRLDLPSSPAGTIPEVLEGRVVRVDEGVDAETDGG